MASNIPTNRKRVSDANISDLKSLLSNTTASVLGPSDEGYPKTLHRWSKAAEKPAGVSIVPRTAEEISIALKYATEHDLDVAVKGGGHSSAGTSSTNGGLLFDLDKMRNVRVDTEKQLLYVQGGCNWGDVDNAAWPYGLATVGGTVHDTGVGGLTLGGGIGWLTGKYGLVIDNLVEVTTVFANGDIIKVSNNENQELFWALCGAGQNFGVATEFVLKAYPQGDIWAGMLIYAPTPENIIKMVNAVNNLFTTFDTPEGKRTKADQRAAGGIVLARPPPAGGQPVIIAPVFFNGPEEEGKEVFKELLDIGPVVNAVEKGPYPKANQMLAPPYGMRASMKGVGFTLPVRPEFVQEMLGEYIKFTEENPDAAGGMVMWEINDATKIVSNDFGSYSNRGYHMNGAIVPLWSKAENDLTCRQWARDMHEMFKKELQRSGEETGKGASIKGQKGAVLLYGNYDQYEEKSRDIFGDNYDKLRELKKKYDPTNLFNKLFAIAPAE